MIRSSRGLVQLSPVQNVPVPILQRRFKGHSYWRWWWWPGERRSFHEFLLLNRCYNFSQSMGPNIVSHCNWKSFWRRLNRCQILIHCTDLCPLEYLCKLPRTFSNTATENHTELHISFFLFWRFKYIKIFTFFEIRSLWFLNYVKMSSLSTKITTNLKVRSKKHAESLLLIQVSYKMLSWFQHTGS